MKKIVVLLLWLLGGSVVYAQPVPPPGLKVVTHGQSLTGQGTVTVPLDVRVRTGGGLDAGTGAGGISLITSCTSGQVLAWSGSAWACTPMSTGGAFGGFNIALHGDSITVGAGDVSTADPSFAVTTPYTLATLTYSNNSGDPSTVISSPRGPVAPYVSGPTTFMGPEISLPRYLVEHGASGGQIPHIIKFGWNGRALNDWLPTSTFPVNPSGGPNMLTQAFTQLDAELAASGKPLAVMIQISGANDATDPTLAANYQANLTTYAAAMRARYGSQVWLIVTQLHIKTDIAVCPYRGNVRAAQAAYVASDPRSTLVNIDEIELNSDSRHWSANGSISAGNRIADAIGRALIAGYTGNAITGGGSVPWLQTWDPAMHGGGASVVPPIGPHAAGDVIYVHAVAGGATGTGTIATPSGWVLVSPSQSTFSGAAVVSAVFRKVATAPGTASPTIAMPATYTDLAARAIVIRGASTTTPEDVTTNATGASLGVTVTGNTTTGTNRTLLTLFGAFLGGGGAHSLNGYSASGVSLAKVYDDDIIAYTNHLGLALASGPIPTAGTYGSTTATYTASYAVWGAHTITLIPAPAAPAPGTVTSIATGVGLTGGPITTTGTIALSINSGSSQSCSAGNHFSTMTSAGIMTCTADAGGGSGPGTGTAGTLPIWATTTTLGSSGISYSSPSFTYLAGTSGAHVFSNAGGTTVTFDASGDVLPAGYVEVANTASYLWSTTGSPAGSADLRLRRSTTKTLTLDDGAAGVATLAVTGPITGDAGNRVIDTVAARLVQTANSADLATVVVGGPCTNCNLTIDNWGRVTVFANGSGGSGPGTGTAGTLPIWATTTTLGSSGISYSSPSFTYLAGTSGTHVFTNVGGTLLTVDASGNVQPTGVVEVASGGSYNFSTTGSPAGAIDLRLRRSAAKTLALDDNAAGAATLNISGQIISGAPITNTSTKWSTGAGAPASSCAAGDEYSNTSGGVGTTLYLCTATNTWTAVTSGGGGVTNSAGNNVVTKSNGTNLVASLWTDDGSTTAYNTTAMTLTTGGVATIGTRLMVGSSITGMYAFANSDSINFGYNDSGNGTAYINQAGYLNGFTTLRNLQIQDGQASTIATFQASPHALNVFGTENVGNGGDTVGAPSTTLYVTNPGTTCGEVRDSTNHVEAEHCASSSGAFFGSFTNHNAFIQSNATNAIKIDTSQNVFALAKFTVTGKATFNGGVTLDDATNGTATSVINATGYNGGTTQFRNIEIDDGKGNKVVVFNGASTALISAFYGHIVGAGSTPSVSAGAGCGVGGSVVGNDNFGKVTVGSSTSSCVLTFAQAWTTNEPSCHATSTSSNSNIRISTASTSAVTFDQTSPSMSGTTFYYQCGGY